MSVDERHKRYAQQLRDATEPLAAQRAIDANTDHIPIHEVIASFDSAYRLARRTQPSEPYSGLVEYHRLLRKLYDRPVSGSTPADEVF